LFVAVYIDIILEGWLSVEKDFNAERYGGHCPPGYKIEPAKIQQKAGSARPT